MNKLEDESKPARNDAAQNVLGLAVWLVTSEYWKAIEKHPTPFRSPHDGIVVLLKEYRELEREVFRCEHDMAAMATEAAQLSAMAIRFLVDLCGQNCTHEVHQPAQGRER